MTGMDPRGEATPLQRTLAGAVLSALHKSGTTQKTLAIRCNLSEKHVSRVLTCQNDGSFETWQRFARALGLRWTAALEDA